MCLAPFVSMRPAELVQIYTRWREYDYFVVGAQIIVVNPRTHEIVAVLEA